MRTNTSADINTDWAINQIVKPGHVNALTRSIKYDYVVTAQMLEGKTGTVDVDELLGGNKINGTTGEVHVLINTMVPDNVELFFPANSVGGPSGTLKVHVHTIGPFTASVGTSGIPYIDHYFHTHGPAEAVTFTSIPRSMHVGAFIMAEPIELMAGGTFIYEMALAELPFLDEQHPGSIVKQAWMSNAVGGGGGSDSILRIFDTVAKKNQGLQYMRMVLGNDILAEVTGQNLKIGPRGSITGAYQDVPGLGYNQNRSAFIDMSEISGIDWTTWFTADMEGYRIWGDSRDYWDVTNPYTEMAIDTASMVIGRVYTIKIHVTKNKHDVTPAFVETHQSEAGAGSLLLRYGQSSGSYGSVVNATVIYNGGRGLYPMINVSASATIMIQTVQGYYSGVLPPGYQANDVVLAVTIGSVTNICVLRSNDSDKPLASDTAQTVSGTATMDMDGALYVAFQHVNRSSQTRYYQLVEPPKYLTSVSVNTSFTIPQIQFQERVPTPDGDYAWENREAFLILAPKDSRPAFYTPYLLAQGSSGDYGFSYLKPNFHPVHLDSRSDDPNGRSDPGNDESYPPEAPCYEAVIYMCRIDENHVLVLGY